MLDPEAFRVNGLHEYGRAPRLEDYIVLIGDEVCRFSVKNGEKGFSRDSFCERFAHELGGDYPILSEPQAGASEFGVAGGAQGARCGAAEAAVRSAPRVARGIQISPTSQAYEP